MREPWSPDRVEECEVAIDEYFAIEESTCGKPMPATKVSKHQGSRFARNHANPRWPEGFWNNQFTWSGGGGEGGGDGGGNGGGTE